jgi:hypothetical protein
LRSGCSQTAVSLGQPLDGGYGFCRCDQAGRFFAVGGNLAADSTSVVERMQGFVADPA